MTLAPVVPTLAVVKYVSGATGAYANEAMSELDWTGYGYQQYQVYQITSASKRHMYKGTVPTFEVDDGGGFDPAGTIREIIYASGIIILDTPLAGAYTVRCATGDYYSGSETTILGGAVARMNTGPQLADVTVLGDTAVSRYPTVKDFTFTLDYIAMKNCASYTTALVGANNDLIFTHEAGGTAGNSCSITYTDAGAGKSLSVSVVGSAIDVQLATNGGGAITSTANDIKAAINANANCQALTVTTRNVAGETGLGVVTALATQSFTGGLNAQNLCNTLKGVMMIVTMYISTSADSRLEGYCYLETDDQAFDPKDVVRGTLTFRGDGKLWYIPS